MITLIRPNHNLQFAIGIDTSETVDPRKPVECFGREASARAYELLDGQAVLLEEDPSQGDVDRYGRALRYIWMADGRLFNLEMLAQGYAFEYTYNLPYKYQAQFKQAERDAGEQGRGLWAPDACNGQHRPAEEAPVAPATAALPTLAPATPIVRASLRGALTITRPPGAVRRSATAMVAAHTAPGAQCSIVVHYKSGPSGRIAGQKRRGRWYASEAAVRRYQREVAERAVPLAAHAAARRQIRSSQSAGTNPLKSLPKSADSDLPTGNSHLHENVNFCYNHSTLSFELS